MSVRRILEETITLRPVHLTLIDPAKQSAERAKEIAGTADQLGSDGFLIGGSSHISQSNLSATLSAVKEVSKKPVIFFPGQDKAFCLGFDAILFLSLLNSRNVDYVIRFQAQSVLLLRQLGIEIIPTGYLIISPGMRVGELGEADLLKRDDVWTASGYAAASEMMGMKYLYLECGSGSPMPVPPEFVRSVKKNISIPVIVGGGIRTPIEASQLVAAGADIVVTGTVVEKKNYKRNLSDIITAVKG